MEILDRSRRMNSMPGELILILICSLVLVYFWRAVLVFLFWALAAAALLGLITAVTYFTHLP
jgi:hypothetical protein